MRQSGRVTLQAILGVFAILAIFIVVFFSKESPGAAAARFMDALARSDVDKLTQLTVLGDKTPEQIKKDWAFTTGVAGKYYSFKWRVASSRQIDDNTGNASIMVERNYGNGSSYEEKFDLDLSKVNGAWKVNVGAISRELYPGLPRADLSVADAK